MTNNSNDSTESPLVASSNRSNESPVIIYNRKQLGLIAYYVIGFVTCICTCICLFIIIVFSIFFYLPKNKNNNITSNGSLL
jgi:hypothetical protein